MALHIWHQARFFPALRPAPRAKTKAIFEVQPSENATRFPRVFTTVILALFLRKLTDLSLTDEGRHQSFNVLVGGLRLSPPHLKVEGGVDRSKRLFVLFNIMLSIRVRYPTTLSL